jgi:hypothetical protein
LLRVVEGHGNQEVHRGVAMHSNESESRWRVQVYDRLISEGFCVCGGARVRVEGYVGDELHD